MKRHKLAVIGCGALAQAAHLPHAQRNPRVELVSVCDVNPDVAGDCRRRFGAGRAETDWRQVVAAPDVEAIVLCTRHDLRGEIIIPALRNGKAVYTEKPLAPSRREMLDIVYASRETRVPVCVGHNRRSSPAVLEFRRLLAKARAAAAATAPAVDRRKEGKLIAEARQQQLLFRVNDDIRSWKGWIFREEEGILFSEMVHFVDLALWFTPSPPVRAFADGSPRGNFTLVVRFGDGSSATLHHSMVGNFGYPKELFEATVNHVTLAMDQHLEIRQCGLDDEPLLQTFPYEDGGQKREGGMAGYFSDLEKIHRETAPGESPRWLTVDKGHYAHLDRFLDHIEGRGPNPCPVEGAVAINRLALKLLDSARLGIPVVVGPEDWNIPE